MTIHSSPRSHLHRKADPFSLNHLLYLFPPPPHRPHPNLNLQIDTLRTPTTISTIHKHLLDPYLRIRLPPTFPLGVGAHAHVVPWEAEVYGFVPRAGNEAWWGGV
jgi:hypothetical protein